MQNPKPKYAKCPVCRAQFSQSDLSMKKSCPKCGTVIPPFLGSQEVVIQINWQELRTLSIYSLRWSKIFDPKKRGNQDAIKALQNIFTRIMKHQPQDARTLIPFRDEVAGRIKRADVSQEGKERGIVSPYFPAN